MISERADAIVLARVDIQELIDAAAGIGDLQGSGASVLVAGGDAGDLRRGTGFVPVGLLVFEAAVLDEIVSAVSGRGRRWCGFACP